MTLKSEIAARLSAFTGLTALVSDRIYPNELPQGVALPAVVFQVISEPRTSNFGADTGDIQARVQVDCYGTKAAGPKAVDDVKEQVRLALQRYRGGNIQDSYIEGGGDAAFEPEGKVYRVNFDFIIWFKES